jgi:2-polyprenyl-3-methyl-5-hydroxy-6-metoxy-1,4-benzoquinol methylase
VMSNSIVHHIPDPIDVFHEMRRVIRPGGVLFVRDLMRPESNEIVEHFVSTYTVDENAHQQQLFRQSLHAALTVDEVRELLQAANFDPNAVQATSDRHWTIASTV